MAKLRLTKAALAKERQHLRLYERLLPSLDLKRRQLTVELEKARSGLREAQTTVEELENQIGRELPMAANPRLNFQGLVTVRDTQIGVENVVGAKLPVLERIDYDVAEYPYLNTPAWVDTLVQRLKDVIEKRLLVAIAIKRVAVLDRAVRRVTQRVNLFDRILIPNAKKNIKKIQIFLGDVERDAVIRSKLAKSKGLLATDRAALLAGGE